MKVKIGNKTFDSEQEPIMLILEIKDKANIAHMEPNQVKYCSYPSNISPEEISKWMDD